MKVTLDISTQGGFTIWESGFWSPEESSGYSLVVADSRCQPLQVIYEKPYQRYSDHFLFFTSVGMHACAVELTNDKEIDEYIYSISLVRFLSFKSSESPKYRVDYNKEVLWVANGMLTTAHRKEELINIVKKEFTVQSTDRYSFERKNLVLAGVEKATTILAEQKLFFGLPRKVDPNRSRRDSDRDEEEDTPERPSLDPSGIDHANGMFPSGDR